MKAVGTKENLRGARRGQLELLYEEAFPFVWRSVRRLGVPPEQAEDAAQDVFLVAARRWADFEHRSTARTWLFSIATHVAKYYRRTEFRHRRRVDALREKEHHAPVPHGQTDAQQTLLRLMDELDDDRRAVYVLAELEGMTAPEIAQAVGANVNTVYTRLRAARRTVLKAAAQIAKAHPEKDGQQSDSKPTRAASENTGRPRRSNDVEQGSTTLPRAHTCKVARTVETQRQRLEAPQQ